MVVTDSATIVVPFVWSVVMEATDGRAPTFSLNTSKGSVAMGHSPCRTRRSDWRHRRTRDYAASACEPLWPLRRTTGVRGPFLSRMAPEHVMRENQLNRRRRVDVRTSGAR